MLQSRFKDFEVVDDLRAFASFEACLRQPVDGVQARRPGSEDSGEAVSAHDSVERWLSASYEAAEPVSPSADRDRDSLNLSGAESANAADDDGTDDRCGKLIMHLLLAACSTSHSILSPQCRLQADSLMHMVPCRSRNGDEITPDILAAMRRASQQMASAQPVSSSSSPASAHDQLDALTPPPNTPAKQTLDTAIGEKTSSGQLAEPVVQDSAGAQSAAAAPHGSEDPKDPTSVQQSHADGSISPETDVVKEDAKEHIAPGKKEAGQAVTAASILTPHTKQLAAGYIPRRQQPEPSYLDRKVRTLQASQYANVMFKSAKQRSISAAQMPCL